jgi:hypothetical protein
MLVVQSQWVLFIELQRRRQIAHQESELAEMQATGAGWKIKLLEISTDFCNQYPNFQKLFTDKQNCKGLLDLTTYYSDLLPTIESNDKEHSVDLHLQKWKEEDRNCPVCTRGLFEGGPDDYEEKNPLVDACFKCWQPFHQKCLLRWLSHLDQEGAWYERPELGLKKCPFCRSPAGKLGIFAHDHQTPSPQGNKNTANDGEI